MIQHSARRLFIQFIERLVEQYHVRLFIKSAGNRYPLLLAAADIFSIFRYDFFELFREMY